MPVPWVHRGRWVNPVRLDLRVLRALPAQLVHRDLQVKQDR